MQNVELLLRVARFCFASDPCPFHYHGSGVLVRFFVAVSVSEMMATDQNSQGRLTNVEIGRRHLWNVGVI